MEHALAPSRLSRRGIFLGALATAGCSTLAATAPHAEPPPVLIEHLQVLSRFVGRWRGAGSGEPGNSSVERTYTPTLAGRFIEERNTSSYAPQPSNPNGEIHHHAGFWSFDRRRGRVVFRQFHQEGFVNQYVASTPNFVNDVLILDSEAIENIPPGFRARETYRFSSPDAFEEVFEIAEPGGEFALYSRNSLTRVG